jgi:hypothetical protein
MDEGIMQSGNDVGIKKENGNLIFAIAGYDRGLKAEELNDHIGYVKKLVASKTPEDLKERLLDILNQLGFSDFAFMGCFHNHKPHFFLSSLPKEFSTHYQDHRLDRYDMAIDCVRTGNSSHFYLSDIQQIINGTRLQTHTFEENQKILELYKKFEFNDAYLMPYKAKRDEISSLSDDQVKTASKDADVKSRLLVALMAKGATQEEFFALTKSRDAVLYLLGDTLIRVFQNQFKNYNPAPQTDLKPIRLLTLMAKYDLNISQAADKLCVSKDSANKYMAAAKKMFGARSQVNAIYRAIQGGFINFD